MQEQRKNITSEVVVFIFLAIWVSFVCYLCTSSSAIFPITMCPALAYYLWLPIVVLCLLTIVFVSVKTCLKRKRSGILSAIIAALCVYFVITSPSLIYFLKEITPESIFYSILLMPQYVLLNSIIFIVFGVLDAVLVDKWNLLTRKKKRWVGSFSCVLTIMMAVWLDHFILHVHKTLRRSPSFEIIEYLALSYDSRLLDIPDEIKSPESCQALPQGESQEICFRFFRHRAP